MYVTDALIQQMIAEYGEPRKSTFVIPCTRAEIDRIRSSQKHGRNHDVTLYILKEDKVVVISKHPYPPGLFRAPSGGLEPGESFLAGIRRETIEETGCEIRVVKFLLRTSVDFTLDTGLNGTGEVTKAQFVFWRSFVFLADYVRGDFKFTDHDEIREVRLADWSDFAVFGAIMRSTNSGGLHYRAQLHDRVVETMSLLK